MDRQHRKLVAILGLVPYLEPGDTRGRETVLNAFTASARRHFAEEEDLLAALGHPGLGRQRLEHARFLAELQGYQEQVREGRDRVLGSAFEPIGDRLSRHILLHDTWHRAILASRERR
jgi:hemerythrin-like metal-binding protein